MHRLSDPKCDVIVREQWIGGGPHITICGAYMPCAEHPSKECTYTQADMTAALTVIAREIAQKACGTTYAADSIEAILAKHWPAPVVAEEPMNIDAHVDSLMCEIGRHIRNEQGANPMMYKRFLLNDVTAAIAAAEARIVGIVAAERRKHEDDAALYFSDRLVYLRRAQVCTDILDTIT